MSANIIFVLLGVFSLLSIVSLFVFKFKNNDRNLTARMRSWWVMISIFSLAITFGKYAILILFMGLSYLAFNEFHQHGIKALSDRHLSNKPIEKISVYIAYSLIALQYSFILLDRMFLYHYFIPSFIALLLGFNVVFSSMITGSTRPYPLLISRFCWAIVISIYALSHVALFAFYQPHSEVITSHLSAPSSISLILYLVFLTQSNDIAQYVWGKSMGKRAILPRISPNKTFAGLCGGIGTSILLSILVAPWLTPFAWQWAIISGLSISVGGFIGDTLLSLFKRQFGIKDYSQFIPGHGGVLDRLDSLVITAPLFFYFVYFVYGSNV